MKKTIIILVSGLILLGGGVFVLRNHSAIATATPLAIQTPTSIAPPKPQPQTIAPIRIEGTPVKLSLPTLDISLPVAPGTYDPQTRTWEISTKSAHYANLTTKPNNISGNTLIYGHYRSNVFAPLRKLKAAELAIVTTDNGHAFYYQLSKVETVDPSESQSVLTTEGEPTLTLQTCTGVFYEKRQLFIFKLIRVA